MRSYLVLTPASDPRRGTDVDHKSTLVLPDGFAWTALFFPWIWLLWNRLWIAATVVFVLQLLSGYLMSLPQFAVAGGLLGFAVNLLVALEGRHYRSEALIRRGWTLETIISAANLDTAEEIYFSSLPEAAKQPMPATAEWAKDARPSTSPASWQAGAQGPFGLFEHGGR